MTDAFFLSGWAGPAGLFPGLAGRAAFAAPFLDGDEAALLDRAAASRARTLVGWSTGAHMILKHAATLLPLFERVALFAPFLRFADCFPARITNAMAVGMERDPEGTTRAFWKNCRVPGQPAWDPAWAAPLAAGLNYLAVSSAPAEPVAAGHVTVFHGAADRIVRASAVAGVMAALPGARLVAGDGGHYPDPAVLETALAS